MKAFLIVFAILASATAAHAQAPFGGQPIPIEPRRNENLRPLPPQNELRVESFRTSSMRCNADLSLQSVQVSARLPVQTDPVRGDQPEIDILIDGVSQGARTMTARDGYVTFSQRVGLAGVTPGEHEVVFVLNGVVRSPPQRASFSCVTLRPSVTETPGVVTRPNVGISAPIYVAIRRIESAIGIAGAPPPPQITYSFSSPLILENPTARSTAIVFRGVRVCEATSEYSRSLQFAVAITAFMVENPQSRFTVTGGRGMSTPRYVDTRGGSLWATGDPLDTPNMEGTPLPAGHQWLVFSGQLPCTSSGNLDLTFNGAGLTESSTSDNTLRLRFITRP